MNTPEEIKIKSSISEITNNSAKEILEIIKNYELDDSSDFNTTTLNDIRNNILESENNGYLTSADKKTLLKRLYSLGTLRNVFYLNITSRISFTSKDSEKDPKNSEEDEDSLEDEESYDDSYSYEESYEDDED